MNILGIETSCDETAAAVVKDGREVLTNVVYTQIPLHKPYGGVVPEFASRAHVEKIGEVVVLHRLNKDQFVRSEFWSLPDALEFRMRESVRDPETAGTARVRELYKEGGIKAKDNPWWKFW